MHNYTDAIFENPLTPSFHFFQWKPPLAPLLSFSSQKHSSASLLAWPIYSHFSFTILSFTLSSSAFTAMFTSITCSERGVRSLFYLFPQYFNTSPCSYEFFFHAPFNLLLCRLADTEQELLTFKQ